ncbi:uncharacterized protein LOC142319589 [Lycorma delicatula]|uniref:uncharacterized protein LOC142319589 n=1 Tax=Lycorma delicatula TaxID=130591 RepID=UPI003F512837
MAVGNLVKMLNDLSKIGTQHHHNHHRNSWSNIPPTPPSPPQHHYRSMNHHKSPPPLPPQQSAIRSHNRCYGHHIPSYPPQHKPTNHQNLRPHFGPGPHGPGICPPQCGYGWLPPSHCVGSYSWMEGKSGSVPHNAVKVGVDRDGSAIFAGRAFHEGDLLPAKVAPSHGGAFVAWGGREHSKFEYEVLCSTHVGWTAAARGDVPPEAICVGQTSNGEKLYMGRVMHEGTLTPGKIQPSHGVLYIPYAGMEVSFTEYEVMVLM